jgi:hypothetical protein
MSLESTRLFVVGDARTGTTSIHHWFLSANIRSIHYYIKEAGQIEPLHKHRRENWECLVRFIESSPYQAFSDYPTRIFFRELMERYREAKFIMTRRRDTATWLRSMTAYFSDPQLDLTLLESYYACLNEEIRSYAEFFGVALLELCIDDDSTVNAGLLGEFVGLSDPPALGRYNRS